MPERAPSGVSAPAAPGPRNGQAEEHGQGEDEPEAAAAPGHGRPEERELHCAFSHRRSAPAPGTARASGGSAASQCGRQGRAASNHRRHRRTHTSRGADPAARTVAAESALTAAGPRTRGRARSEGRGRPRPGAAHERHRPGPVPSPLQAVELGQGREPVEEELEVQARGLADLESLRGSRVQHLVVAELAQMIGAVGPLRAVGDVGEPQTVRGGEDQGAAGAKDPPELRDARAGDRPGARSAPPRRPRRKPASRKGKG